MALERSTNERVRRVGSVLLLILVLLLLVVARVPLLRGLSTGLAPLLRAGTWVADHTTGAFLDATAREARVRALEDEVSRLSARVVTEETAIRKAEELTALLELSERTSIATRAATVLGRTLTYRVSELFLNCGTIDGVQVGMPVLTSDGTLLGKVVRVLETHSVVATLLDPTSSTAVTLLNRTRTLGIAQGLSGSVLSLKYVPQDEEMHVGDLVLTSGIEDRIAHGLPVGRITSVRRNDAEPFQEAVVEPLFDVRRVESVIILLAPALCGESGCSLLGS